MKRVLFYTLLYFLSFSAVALASGFQINETGARGMSMGGAYTGYAADASAVYFNPGAITFLEGTNIYGGFSYIKPAATFRGPLPSTDEYSVKEQFFNPINFYMTHKITDKLSVGLGLNNPFGLGTHWDDEWAGKYLALETEIRTFYLTPIVAYKITDELSIGAGPIIAYGDVEIIRMQRLTPFANDAKLTLDGDATAFGFVAAVYYKPTKCLSFGLSYRSEVKFEFEGDANMDVTSQFSSLLPQGPVSAPLTTPQNLAVGLAYHPIEKLTVTADFQYIGWESYDKLEITFENNGYKSSAERNYENSTIIRGGVEYNLYERLSLRAGLYYDNNPVKEEYLEPTLPDADRIGMNLGVGVAVTKHLTLDLAYLYLRFDERTVNESEVNYGEGTTPFTGVYNSHAHIIGVNLGYNF